MKIKVNWLAGKYKITQENDIPQFNDKVIYLNLSSNEAKTLMKKKKNEDSLFVKLGFKEIELVKDYEG